MSSLQLDCFFSGPIHGFFANNLELQSTEKSSIPEFLCKACQIFTDFKNLLLVLIPEFP